MEVILLADVKGLGKKDQKVKVSDGYANNFLIKKKLAVPVSQKSMEILGIQQENARIAEENAVKTAEELKTKIEKITLEFSIKVGKEGKLFGSISTKEVTDALLEKYGITIDKRKFIDKGPLDSLGFYKLKNELHKGVIASINVHISGEKTNG